MKRASLLWNPAFLPTLACAYLAFIWLFFMPIAPKSDSLWKGYYTLLIREGSGAERLFETFQSDLSRGRPVVSRYTAPVFFNGFHSPEKTTVSDIGEKLDPADPRFDPFLRTIMGYFSTQDAPEAWQIVFVPASGGAAALYARIVRFLGLPGAGAWRMADFDFVKTAATLACAACIAVFFSLQLRKKRKRLRVAVCFFVAAWIPPLVRGGAGVACVFFAFSLAWFPLFTECAEYAERASSRDSLWRNAAARGIAEKLFRFVLVAFLFPAAYRIVLGPSPFAILVFSGETAVSLILLGVPFHLSRLGKRIRSGKAFERSKGDRPVLQAVVFMLAFVCTFAAASLQVSRYSGLPAPRRVPGFTGIGWEWLHAEGDEVRVGHLPNFAQAVAHAAFIEGFDYGRGYSMPLQDERVLVREFTADPASSVIRDRFTTIAQFDSAWLQGLMERAPSGSIERMLLDQGGPAVVQASGSSRFVRDAVFSLACILVMAQGLLGVVRHGPLISGDFWRFNFKPRKKRRT